MSRPPGSVTKNKRGLLARLKQEYGKDFHPIMKMAQNCVELQNDAETEEDASDRMTKLKAANAEWSRVAEYTEPKLKATEYTGHIEISEVSVEPELESSEWKDKHQDSMETAAGAATRTD